MSTQAWCENREIVNKEQLRISEAPDISCLTSESPSIRENGIAGLLLHGLTEVVRHIVGTFHWVKTNVRVSRSVKRMRISESVGLGEKRVLALLEIDGQSFLIGASPNSVSLLAEMQSSPDFRQILSEKQEFSS